MARPRLRSLCRTRFADGRYPRTPTPSRLAVHNPVMRNSDPKYVARMKHCYLLDHRADELRIECGSSTGSSGPCGHGWWNTALEKRGDARET